MIKKDTLNAVASFTDAWIETVTLILALASDTVASFTDAWIETGHTHTKDAGNQSHLLQMRGLKPFGYV